MPARRMTQASVVDMLPALLFLLGTVFLALLVSALAVRRHGRIRRTPRPDRAWRPMLQADERAARKVSFWTGRSRSGLTMREWHEGRTVRTIRGDLVRSRAEARVADWLHVQGHPYEYEPEVCGFRPDFLLPDHGIVIEYWGGAGSGNVGYDRDRRTKTRAYRRAGFGLVSLAPGKEVPLEEDLRRQLWHRMRENGGPLP